MPDRDRFLPDIEVAEAADQAEPVKLPRTFLEAADEQHLLVELEEFLGARLVALLLRMLFLEAAKLKIVICCSGFGGFLAGRVGGGFCQNQGPSSLAPQGMAQRSFWLPISASKAPRQRPECTVAKSLKIGLGAGTGKK